jgi:hypothetical protein
LPFERIRRECYQYQKQPPSDHIENLDRYLLLASSLIPRNPTLGHFRIRHPDLQPGNIIVDSNLRIISLIDLQHTSILPLFLLAGIPERLQNHDLFSQTMTRPSLPEHLDDLDEDLYRRRLVHYHYVKNTEKYNQLHYAALTDPMGMLRRRLFCHASDMWDGETLALEVALIDATENWKTLTEGGPPCPIVFNAEDVHETRELDAGQREVDEILERVQKIDVFGSEGWVPAEHYEEAMASSKQLKEATLAGAESEEERVQIAAHWPLDDMDEEEYI